MRDLGISPLYWTSDVLAEQGNDVIHDLAVRCVGTVVAYHVMLGRCLLAGERNGLFAEHGCSCVSHYGAVVLGIAGKEASEALRVARLLETLPLLSRAAEAGELGWSKLREVVRKATVATERYWLHLCKNRTYAELLDLLRFTKHGDFPNPYLVRGRLRGGVRTELRCSLEPESMAVIDRGLQMLSEAEGRNVPLEDAMVRLFSQYLAHQSSDERALEKVMEEACKDVQAGHYRMEKAVQAARDIATDMGFLEHEMATLYSRPFSDEAEEETRIGQDRGGLHDEREVGIQNLRSEAGQASLRHTRVPVMEQPQASVSAEQWLGNAAAVQVLDSTVAKPSSTSAESSTTERSSAISAPPSATTDGPSTTSAKPASEATPTAGTTQTKRPANTPEETAWLTVAAAEISTCPSDETLLLASSQPTWRNQKLKFNPTARGLTKAQRHDLLRRDGYCCPTPGCPHRLWLQMHHQKMYSEGGVTAPQNLLPVCLGCHENVHEGHLIIKGCPEKGTLEFWDAHGRRLGIGTPLERAAWLDSYIERQGEENASRAFTFLQGLGPVESDGPAFTRSAASA